MIANTPLFSIAIPVTLWFTLRARTSIRPNATSQASAFGCPIFYLGHTG